MPRKWVYRIGVWLIFFAVIKSPVSYLIFGQVEKGRVVQIVYEHSGIFLFPSSAYPRVEFTYQNKSFTVLGEENDNLLVGEDVQVIFFKNNPSKARIYSFWNLFIDTFIQLPIGLLIWWAFFKSYPNIFKPPKKEPWYENFFGRR